jgi:hypothetical protein
MEIHQRLGIFFQRLQAAPAASTAQEAMSLVCRLIEQVEDEFCPVPRRSPPPIQFSGRMYAPPTDRISTSPDGRIVAETRHHRVTCFADGRIVIVHKPGGRIGLAKEGAKR